jgi:hypothetical protein
MEMRFGFAARDGRVRSRHARHRVGYIQPLLAVERAHICFDLAHRAEVQLMLLNRLFRCFAIRLPLWVPESVGTHLVAGMRPRQP